MSAINYHCQECGMLLHHPAEYHPFEFCILKKAGQDPRRLYANIARHAAISNKGKAARLREALEKVKQLVAESKWCVHTVREIGAVVAKALSEDTRDEATLWREQIVKERKDIARYGFGGDGGINYPDDGIEKAKLRESLEAIKWEYETATDPELSRYLMYREACKALSSHTEDTERPMTDEERKAHSRVIRSTSKVVAKLYTEDTGILKVRELWDNKLASYDYQGGIADTLRALGYIIPGITDGGEADDKES